MAKKEISREILDLKKELEEGRAVMGTKVVRKELGKNLLSKIYLSSNCPEKDGGELRAYAEMSKVPIVVLAISNEELGVMCKKYHSISVLGIKKKQVFQ